jgi:hypothetical protein
VRAEEIKITKTDLQIDALDPGIKLLLREKMKERSIVSHSGDRDVNLVREVLALLAVSDPAAERR